MKLVFGSLFVKTNENFTSLQTCKDPVSHERNGHYDNKRVLWLYINEVGNGQLEADILMKKTLFNKSNVQTTFSVKKIASFSLVQCNFFEVFSIEHGKGRLCQCQLRKHFFTCIRSSFLKSSINHCLESLQPLFFNLYHPTGNIFHRQ